MTKTESLALLHAWADAHDCRWSGIDRGAQSDASRHGAAAVRAVRSYPNEPEYRATAFARAESRRAFAAALAAVGIEGREL